MLMIKINKVLLSIPCSFQLFYVNLIRNKKIFILIIYETNTILRSENSIKMIEYI